MKNFKDITLSIFAIIGFVAILSSFNNQPQEQKTTLGTPESHVWAFGSDTQDSFMFNKVTGEVRFLPERGDKDYIGDPYYKTITGY
jgi:hypothetical protein